MRVQVGDVSLWFEVLGTRYITGDTGLVERPTVVLVHGGPGIDSGGSPIRDLADDIAGYAQVLLFDQRGNGRSDYSTPAKWTLEQWADDVRGLCEMLGIDKPIVVGPSFGGLVAQVYGGRYPDHPAAVGLIATAMRFDYQASIERFRQLGGEEVAAVAAQDFYATTDETNRRFAEVCLPYLSHKPDVHDYLRLFLRRALRTPAVELAFNLSTAGMDLRPYVEKITCPVLVLGGADDPLIPARLVSELADTLGEQASCHLLDDCGHLLWRDQGEQAYSIMREFVLAQAHLQPTQTPTGERFA
jgi:pimeloyl-ACP methyl ester carboxylesterase